MYISIVPIFVFCSPYSSLHISSYLFRWTLITLEVLSKEELKGHKRRTLFVEGVRSKTVRWEQKGLSCADTYSYDPSR